MAYLAESLPVRRDPTILLEGAVSIVVVGLVYRTQEPSDTPSGHGRISRYAWGEDYHQVIRSKLRRMGENLREKYPDVNSRRAVDSAPIMERDYAVLAGLGWIGKNTLLLHQQKGSWLFLGVLLVDTELDYDDPNPTDHCGSCRRCLDACPTKAFDGPYQLDATRCISYLTIEHRSTILSLSRNIWATGSTAVMFARRCAHGTTHKPGDREAANRCFDLDPAMIRFPWRRYSSSPRSNSPSDSTDPRFNEPTGNDWFATGSSRQ